MKLEKLLKPLLAKRIEGDASVEIADIETDSRKAKKGVLFVCLPGHTADGHDFAKAAREKGAVAVLTEKDAELPEGIVEIRVSDARKALSVLADRFYGKPSKKLRLIGVTGTNGKTTTASLIEAVAKSAGQKTGLIGTIHAKIGDEIIESKNTTPDILELQRLLKRMAGAGVQTAAMEVSSHALDMGRTWGCRFSTAVFTNLTQDHLDYHKTMESYRAAKGLLFSRLGNGGAKRKGFAVLNADDPASNIYAKETAAQVATYGIKNAADVRAEQIENRPEGVRFLAKTFKGDIELALRLRGTFNVYNALAAMSACLCEGFSLEEIKRGLESVEGVRGRLEAVEEGQNFNVIVDYAHTPDSLENALKTAREFTKGKLYCVVGCGGDRDKTKRPIMAKIAAEFSDLAVLTSDNPRSEEPESILADMAEGLRGTPKKSYAVIADRKAAIEHAIGKAKAGDCVLIAGKGHEDYQIVKGQTLRFDDREVASEALKTKLK